MLIHALVQFILLPPWAGVALLSLSVRKMRLFPCPVMDGLMCHRRNTNGVLRVQQLFAVPEDVFFCYGVQMVDADAWPHGSSIPQYPVCDGMVFASQVAAIVPCNDPVPELPPLSRLVEVLVQPSVKPKGVSPHFPVQLQIFQPLLIGRQGTELSVGFHRCHPIIPFSCSSSYKSSITHHRNTGIPNNEKVSMVKLLVCVSTHSRKNEDPKIITKTIIPAKIKLFKVILVVLSHAVVFCHSFQYVFVHFLAVLGRFQRLGLGT